MPNQIQDIKELAEHIYDLDAEVYCHLGSSLGRVFNRDRDRCVKELVQLLTTRPHGDLVRSELALIANMARTIEDKEERKLCMSEYNRILNAVMSLSTSFASGDVIDPKTARLNEFNLQNRFSEEDHLIICISWTYGSGGIDVGFKLADKLKINYYDEQIFTAVLKRLDAEKDSLRDTAGYTQHVKDEMNQSPANAFLPDARKSLKERMREFSRYHGLSKRDAVFFNQSDLLCEMAKKEDFIVMGRCGDRVMTNNGIPHISIYITAPFEQRVHRAIEVNEGLTEKKAHALLKKLDRQHASYYNFYTGRSWGHANNYDLCINTASYGIDGTVEFILRMINRA
ncbi:MAG: cytidylate kinase-like family protein [Lachnospiraceae bacterium]|jgi:cytidylate kinase|nr:cytidylate kinase-like family protein [Lachnospiraceae bacterium]